LPLEGHRHVELAGKCSQTALRIHWLSFFITARGKGGMMVATGGDVPMQGREAPVAFNHMQQGEIPPQHRKIKRDWKYF
jgi:hypothetical protein